MHAASQISTAFILPCLRPAARTWAAWRGAGTVAHWTGVLPIGLDDLHHLTGAGHGLGHRDSKGPEHGPAHGGVIAQGHSGQLTHAQHLGSPIRKEGARQHSGSPHCLALMRTIYISRKELPEVARMCQKLPDFLALAQSLPIGHAVEAVGIHNVH